jgi:NADH:ubiquinone oxidoreductase subunit 3 (subunit A)
MIDRFIWRRFVPTVIVIVLVVVAFIYLWR